MNLLMSDGNSDFIEDSPMEISEAVLVSTAKSGDTDAFIEMSKCRSTRLLRTIYRITKNWQDALQNSLLKAFSHLTDFQGNSQFFHMAHADCERLGMRLISR